MQFTGTKYSPNFALSSENNQYLKIEVTRTPFQNFDNEGIAFDNPEVDTFMHDFESSDSIGELDEPISQAETKKASKYITKHAP